MSVEYKELVIKPDTDCVFTGGPTDSFWVTVGSISVRIERTDEGVVCDMYAKGIEDLDIAELASTYAFFSEADAAVEEYKEENPDEES